MVFDHIREDISAIYGKDPAARSTLEILFCYPGLHALWFHRRAHWLWLHNLKFFARFISHISRFLTGIEIHPGATMGRRVVIDHGMGVVIGETAEVGNDVLIYMGVVLGGTALENVKRHPTIEADVILGSGATILGPIRIGKGAKVGAGSVVVRTVPPGATVVGVPGRIAGPEHGRKTDEQTEEVMPDPMLRVISRLLDRQNQLEERLRTIEQTKPDTGPAALPQEVVCENEIREALKEVIDPEVGIDIVDLGLIKEIRVAGTRVEIDMVLTCKTCPLTDHLCDQVRRKALGVCGIGQVTVNVLDEPWNWDRFVKQRGNLRQI
ncbi:serine O-acetyltransferase [Methanoregula formicica]|jgi:serine O-acetyltransferase|uniref:Serine acetyltransferase n=1 Tax=Methanoregula formicica (strain DSM 22288 / NBRC 105244 / SMSP) TaxID=593750 RepID=L0HI48_METFS|nr:serine O-acetyltransferase [Methanoregula formicica]AGB03461.1 serine O-acetyltransferase [Methanoregula formicica SMSP]